MTANGWFQIGLFLLVIFADHQTAGHFHGTRVFKREKTFLDPAPPADREAHLSLTGVDEQREMRWTEYAVAMLLFSGGIDGASLPDRAHAKPEVLPLTRRIWPT